MVEDSSKTPEGRRCQDRHTAGPMSIDREISCPSAGTNVSAYREVGMSASSSPTVSIPESEGSFSMRRRVLPMRTVPNVDGRFSILSGRRGWTGGRPA